MWPLRRKPTRRAGDVFDSPTGLSDASLFCVCISGRTLCGEHAAPLGGWLGNPATGPPWISGSDNMAFALRGFTPLERQRGFSGLQFTSVSRGASQRSQVSPSVKFSSPQAS
jgi:hypothetical protein